MSSTEPEVPPHQYSDGILRTPTSFSEQMPEAIVFVRTQPEVRLPDPNTQ